MHYVSRDTNRPSRRQRWILVGMVVAGLAVAAVAWPELWRGTSQESSSSASDPPEAGLARYEQDERDVVPDVEGSTLGGERLALSDLRGHIVVVNVWGSWCAPCREEAPDLARLARETRSQGVRFLGIDTRDNKTAARAFVDEYEIPYPSLYDPDGSLMVAFNGVIPISAVPSTLVIDPDGGIAARVVGKVTYSTLRGLVEDVQAETGDGRGAAGGRSAA